MVRRGTLLLFAAALAIGAVAARAQAPAIEEPSLPDGAIEARAPDDLALAARLDADMSTLAAAIAACVQDGGGPQPCLCAERPAVSTLIALADEALARRPDWAAPGALVVWRSGPLGRSMSVPGVRLEAADALAACQR